MHPPNALTSSFLCCASTAMAESELTSNRNFSMAPPPHTGETGNSKDSRSLQNSNASETELFDSGPYWKCIGRRRRAVMKEMRERKKQRESYLFPMRGMTGERFGQHVDLIQKQNANFGISAIFMAGLQAQLLSILPGDPDNQTAAIVWVTALFYAAVLLDTLAALFSIWSTLMYNNAVAAPITNLFDDDEGDSQNKSKRAVQWGKPLQPYTALVNVRAGYVLQSIFAWFFIPGIACMVIGLLIFVWSQQHKAVAWAGTSVVILAVLSLPVLGIWNGATAVHHNPKHSKLGTALVKAGCDLARTGNAVRNAWGFPVQRPSEDIEKARRRRSSSAHD